MTLAGFIMTGIMTTFLFLGRSGANVQNYSDMEAQARRALELFAQDVRQASSISWQAEGTRTETINGVSTLLKWEHARSVRLVVDSQTVTYTFAANTNTFYRTSGTTTALVSGITMFSFTAYKINGALLPLADLTAANRSTKQLQISLEAERSSRTAATATNLVLSARYILRNKRVTT